MIGIGVGIDYALFIVTRYRTALHRTGSPEARGHRSDEHVGPRRRIRRVHRDGVGARHLLDGSTVPARPRRRHLARGRRSRCWRRSPCSRPCSASSDSRSTASKSVAAPRASVRPFGTAGRAPSSAGRSRSRSRVSSCSLLIAVPALQLRLGNADASNDPKSSTTHQAYDLIARGFGPGANGPILVVAESPSGNLTPGLPHLEQALRATPGVASVTDAATQSRPGPRRSRRSTRPPGRRTRPPSVSSTGCAITSFPTRSPAPACACTSAAKPRAPSTSPTSSARGCRSSSARSSR